MRQRLTLFCLSLFLPGSLASVAQTVTQTVAQTAPAPKTLAKVRAAHTLNCGVDFEEAEYSTEDAHGNHSRFDLDLCKAVAVAALGPEAKFNAVPFRAEEDALDALQTGEIDVLATASVNFRNTATLGLGFTTPIFHDHQAFLVNRSSGIHSVHDLAGKKVCFLGGTEIELQLQAFMAREAIAYLPFSFQEEGEMEAAFITGNCAAVTADVSQLAYERLAFKPTPASFEILPDIVAPDPLAPAFRLDDLQWASLVRWTVEALLLAEAGGITQSNVVARKSSTDPAHSPDIVTQRLLGSLHGYGQSLGLPDDWAVPVIEAVGNYGELFERTLGSGSVMKLPRGADNLWTKGGVLDPLPIR